MTRITNVNSGRSVRFLCQSAIASLALTSLALTSVAFSQEKADVKKDAQPVAAVTLEHIAKYQLEPYIKHSAHWGKEIARLSGLNSTADSEGAILFLGSSSVVLWNGIETDLPSWKSIRRGFGGSRFCDQAFYTPNLVKDLSFQAVAIFVANDIAGSALDKEPGEVARLARSVVESVRSQNPDAPILFISVTATPSRFQHWPKIEKVNQALAELAGETENAFFLDTKTSFLREDGTPNPDYFVKDMLHLNATGYALWGKLIDSKLREIPGLKPVE